MTASGSMTSAVNIHGVVMEDITESHPTADIPSFSVYMFILGLSVLHAPRLQNIRSLGDSQLAIGTYIPITGDWQIRNLLVSGCNVDAFTLVGDAASSAAGSITGLQFRDCDFDTVSLSGSPDVVINDGILVHPGNRFGYVSYTGCPQLIYDTQHPLAVTPSYGTVARSFTYGAHCTDFEAPIPNSTAVSGAGASVTYQRLAALKGTVATLSTGTTSTGSARASCVDISYEPVAVAAETFTYYRADVAIPVLSTAGETYTLYLGFLELTSFTAYMLFIYSHALNSGNWRCVTSGASTSTTNTSTPAVAYGAYDTVCFEIVVIGTSEVRYYINKTLVATHTSNLPDFATFGALTPIVSIAKSVGTTPRLLHADVLGTYLGMPAR